MPAFLEGGLQEYVDDLEGDYRSPLPESQKIAGLVAFLNEKVNV